MHIRVWPAPLPLFKECGVEHEISQKIIVGVSKLFQATLSLKNHLKCIITGVQGACKGKKRRV